MMHGHPPQPQQHHLAHPPPPTHQAPPPPHLPHLTSVPPPNVPPQGAIPQRDHPGPRINNRHHHHPRVPPGGGGVGGGGDHHQSIPHMPLQQQQNSRKPQHYGNNGMVSGGGVGIPSKHQQPAMGGHPPKSLPYNGTNSSAAGGGHHHHQQPHSHHQSHHSHSHHHNHHSAGPIPVVSAAGPGASKARMIPSHEPKIIHNHSNATPASNTSNAVVVQQTETVQLTVALSSSSATSTVISNNSTAAITTGTGSIPTGGGGGGSAGGGVCGGGGIAAVAAAGGGGVSVVTSTASLAANASNPSDSGQKDSTLQPQSQQPNQLLSSVPENLANTKEKTPMCLVNELARYNKIQHQYRLTGESGPAHKKRFTVTLKLGDEEYTAEGPSIKKAQHSAAHEAIGATKYKHPPAKINRTKSGGKPNIGNITPTVELNALAMKRGEPTIYETEQVVTTVPPKFNMSAHPPPGGPNGAPPGGGGHNFFSAPPPGPHYGGYHRGNGMYNNPPPTGLRYGAPPPNSYHRRPVGGKPDYHPRGGSYYYNHHMPPVAPPVPEVYKVTLHVGERTFLGEGHTLQAARHDAAARALEVLKPLTPDTSNALSECHDSTLDSDDPNSELKSPISLVHEMALKRKLSVQFEVHGEKGPPHMKVFTTLCKVGDIVTEGEGNGKKLSKKRAAENMLEELKKLPPASPEKSTRVALKQKRKVPLPKKKTRNLIKDKSEDDPSDMVNPISRLMQIQQARKEKEPVYTLLEERGVARRREFIMEVVASGKTATGVGPTKKLAKKEAAENLLVLLGYGRSTVPNGSSPNKENISSNANDVPDKPSRKVIFNDGTNAGSATKHGGTAGRQIVPGVLQLNSGISGKSHVAAQPKDPPQENGTTSDSNTGQVSVGASTVKSTKATTTTVASSGTSDTVKTPTSSNPDVGRMKEQLMYLAQLLKFDVMFSDFPKGNHGEYLTLVTLSTEPPQLCHGSGASLEESHDEAARGALEILSKIGLDNVKPKGSGGGGYNATSGGTSEKDESKPKTTLSNGLKK